MSDLEWGTPPPVNRGHRRSKYDPIVEALKNNPGKYAMVMEGVNSASAKVLVQRGCKITTRSLGDGTNRVNVWAMYPTDGPDAATGDDGDDAEVLQAEVTIKRPAKKAAAATGGVKAKAKRPSTATGSPKSRR